MLVCCQHPTNLRANPAKSRPISRFAAPRDGRAFRPGLFRFLHPVSHGIRGALKRVKPTLKKWIKRVLLGGLACLALLCLLLLLWLSPALYNRFFRFPGEQRDWLALRTARQPVPTPAGWQEFRGVVHSHSELSHDCEVPFADILRVLHTNHLDFICLSDHCTDGRADFDAQWRGLVEGRLFIPGFEMRQGFMPFGVRPGIVLSNATDNATLARQIVEGGGLLFFAHPEEPRDWDRPELAGMEIFNIHSDFKQLGLRRILPDLLLNHRAYPEQVVFSIVRRPTPFLQRWDALNATRRITGVAGNDCHQNTGVRAFYTTNRTLRVEDTSPETLAEYQLNPVTRLLARLAFGSLEPGRKLFHVELDPYHRMSRLVNTHVLARELSEPAILDALRQGRAFVGFNLLADSTGFQWLATNRFGMAVMGQNLPWNDETLLHAAAPCPCRFTILKDGVPVSHHEGREFRWKPPGPGKYRVEAELKVRGRWTPWVYANPIALRPPDAEPSALAFGQELP